MVELGNIGIVSFSDRNQPIALGANFIIKDERLSVIANRLYEHMSLTPTNNVISYNKESFLCFILSMIHIVLFLLHEKPKNVTRIYKKSCTFSGKLKPKHFPHFKMRIKEEC